MTEYLYSGLVLIVDLEKEETEEIDLEDELIEEKIGGAAVNIALYEEHKEDDPIILGTGIFTSTLVPGSALGIITAKSPINKRVCHVPITLFAGCDLKLSGFDFVVIKGKAETPVYLWLRDMIADIHDASEVWNKDTWETTDYLRSELGEERIQVLNIGTAGENKVDISQICNNYWGSADRFGIASIFGDKNLKAIAMRGLGELEIKDPKSFFDKALELLEVARNRKIDVLDLMPNGRAEIENMLHRRVSCFNCGYACNLFLKFREDPKVMVSSHIEEPGILVQDISHLIGFSNFKLSLAEIIEVIEKCYRLGLDPVSVSKIARGDSKEKVMREIEGFASGTYDLPEARFDGIIPYPTIKDSGLLQGFGIFSNWMTLHIGDVTDITEAEAWVYRNALSYILGICPILMLGANFNEKDLLELINLGTEFEIDSETLSDKIKNMVGDSIKLGGEERDIHNSLKSGDFDSNLKDLLRKF
ncbi:MAG: aldehyde ferredoxin oxidoreductase N-terminal domain-containing protein [Candidatus Hydrothermarchaeota archaeon]